MIKKRLIVSLILKDGMVVQTLKFKHTNIIHRDPAVAVEHFNKWAIDELLVIDVRRNMENRPKLLDAAEDCPAALLPGAATASEMMYLGDR